MEQQKKYTYPEPIKITNRQWPDKIITAPPVWASVDLRDGNQALPIPMNPEQKLEYYQMLCNIGFKEIEVSFPSASQDDFDFMRRLVNEGLIPGDVRIMALTQMRRQLIDRTVESMAGIKHGILHSYLAASDLHGRFVFGRNRTELLQMAVDGTKMAQDIIAKYDMTGKLAYEFSPEEFTDSDIDFVIDLCTAVKETWGEAAKKDFILNLPATVERRPPNQYADMIEYFCNKYPYRKDTTISLHAHNDQGCAVAATELALLAGADRVEGTVFGHGERTGNLDITVLALNLYSRGIKTGLDFSNMQEIVRIVENNSGIEVHPRHPYAGQLVFTAFSGSHQDAIRKGMDEKENISSFFEQGWKMPYLHIDPADLGREYEKLIRINSQSGKGGVVFLLEKEFGIYPPKAMHPEIGKAVQNFVDKNGGEIDSNVLLKIFRDNFVNITGPYEMSGYSRTSNTSGDLVGVEFSWQENDRQSALSGSGNGPMSAVVNTLRDAGVVPPFTLEDFSEKTLGTTADAKALAFVGIRMQESGKLYYGAGEHSNIDRAALNALVSALNRAARAEK